MKRLFVSDVHVGYEASQYSKLLHLLSEENFDEIYMVGDVFDLWRKKWEEILEHNFEFINYIGYKNIPIFYIIGNHDRDIDKHLTIFEKIKFLSNFDLELDGKKVRIIHGHEYDKLVMDYCFFAKLLTRVQEFIYKFFHVDFKWMHFSLAKKKSSKHFDEMMKKIKDQAISDSIGYDVLIMGHTHVPEFEIIGNFTYLNLGDWIEHSTYAVEENGKLTFKTYS